MDVVKAVASDQATEECGINEGNAIDFYQFFRDSLLGKENNFLFFLKKMFYLFIFSFLYRRDGMEALCSPNIIFQEACL